jgi:hypothetical protein
MCYACVIVCVCVCVCVCAWIKETGRKPNGREEKRTNLSVVADQGWRKRLRGQKRALLCEPSRDVDSRKPRALLCKPSRDVDSHKLILAVVLDQGLAKKTQEKGHCMQIGRIYTETESQACKV